MRVIPPRGPARCSPSTPDQSTSARMPFALVATLFEAMPVPVPRVLGHDDALGIVGAARPGRRHAPGPPAGDARRRARVRCIRKPSPSSRRCSDEGQSWPRRHRVAYGLAFDVPKLTFELDFFVTHFLEGHRHIVLAGGERAALAEKIAALTSELSSRAPGGSVTATTIAAT